jgi:hypothetical protein
MPVDRRSLRSSSAATCGPDTAERNPREPAMSTTLKIILIVLVLLIGGCAGCAYWSYQKITEVRKQVDDYADKFVIAWNAKDVDALYALAKEGDSTIVEDKFRADLKVEMEKIGDIKAHSLTDFKMNSENNVAVGVVTYNLQGSSSDGILTLRLTKELDGKIAGFTVSHAMGK